MTWHQNSTDLLRSGMGAFLVCLVMPAYFVDGLNPAQQAHGWTLVLGGWTELSRGNPAWLANPCLVAGWVAMLRSQFRSALQCSAAALAAGLSFVLADSVVDEHHVALAISGLGMGYFAWLLSQVLTLVAAAVAVRNTSS